MKCGFRDRPAGLLTSHFFTALFDFGVFTQDGADAFVRVVIGLVSLLFSLGLLLVYMFGQKYAALSAAAAGTAYAQALLADTALAIALPMWIVAFVTVLVSQSLFPDETDFRVLMPLPVGRGVVFGAKLLALALFAGLFTLTGHVAVTPLVMLISAGRWAVDPPLLPVLAFWVAGITGASFALLAIVAVNGLLITCLPRNAARAAAGAMRTGMLGALVVALAFVIALPARSVGFTRHSRLLLLAPPAWFMGLDRVLLGHRDAYVTRLAQLAGVGLVSTAVIAVATYIVLYRRFDRVMLHAFAVSRQRRRRRREGLSPARAAVRDFMAATLRRSALHQGVLAGLSACGVALALNSLMRNGALTWLSEPNAQPVNVLIAVAWIPFPLITVLGVAARAALALPVEPKANWIFRLTEDSAIRADQLDAAERLIAAFAALIPVALTLPVQWMAAGPHALAAAAITGVAGLVWTEVLLRDWRRIPFTCSYMPGKHSVAQMSLIGVSGFLVVSTVGTGIEAACLRGRGLAPILVVVAVLSVVILVARHRRRRRWRLTPLAFEDELPSDIQVFRLSS